MKAALVCLSVVSSLLLPGPFETEAKEPKKQVAHKVKVVKFILANAVEFYPEGHCRVLSGRHKGWRLPAFPAKVPRFEACFTVKSKQARGLQDFTLSVVDSKGKALESVDGVLDLGVDGQATQVVEWEQLNIPVAGKYRMVIDIKGTKAGVFPMRFTRR